jgi:predicted nucleic acid-binding protein
MDKSLFARALWDSTPLGCELTASRGARSSQPEHNADRWIAATAVRLGVPLVSNDTIFRNAPGVELETFDLP